jgi:hypothetical protein
MTNYFKVDGGTDGIRAIGQRILMTAEELHAKAQPLLEHINTLEGGAPWGGDEYGTAFVKKYTEVPAGATKPYNDLLKEHLQDVGTRVSGHGQTVTGTMDQLDVTDAGNAKTVSSATDTGVHMTASRTVTVRRA